MVTIDQTSDKVITVYRDYTFSSLGTGTFKSAAMAEEGEDFTTWEVEVQKADQISWYKAMNLYEKGYNIVFKVNEANEVTVESQPAWKHASYGEVFVSGKGALEDGVITVKLSHDVPMLVVLVNLKKYFTYLLNNLDLRYEEKMKLSP